MTPQTYRPLFEKLAAQHSIQVASRPQSQHVWKTTGQPGAAITKYIRIIYWNCTGTPEAFDAVLAALAAAGAAPYLTRPLDPAVNPPGVITASVKVELPV